MFKIYWTVCLNVNYGLYLSCFSPHFIFPLQHNIKQKSYSKEKLYFRSKLSFIDGRNVESRVITFSIKDVFTNIYSGIGNNRTWQNEKISIDILLIFYCFLGLYKEVEYILSLEVAAIIKCQNPKTSKHSIHFYIHLKFRKTMFLFDSLFWHYKEIFPICNAKKLKNKMKEANNWNKLFSANDRYWMCALTWQKSFSANMYI